jgi:hypothetical protein
MNDQQFSHTPVSHDDLLHALANSDLDELTRRLVLFAHNEQDAEPQVVLRAVQEALEGEHEDLYRRGQTPFAFLALVIGKIA